MMDDIPSGMFDISDTDMGDRLGVSSSSISVLLVMTDVSHSMDIVLGMLGVMVVVSVLMP